jgi:hypothetical protein
MSCLTVHSKSVPKSCDPLLHWYSNPVWSCSSALVLLVGCVVVTHGHLCLGYFRIRWAPAMLKQTCILTGQRRLRHSRLALEPDVLDIAGDRLVKALPTSSMTTGQLTGSSPATVPVAGDEKSVDSKLNRWARSRGGQAASGRAANPWRPSHAGPGTPWCPAASRCPCGRWCLPRASGNRHGQ